MALSHCHHYNSIGYISNSLESERDEGENMAQRSKVISLYKQLIHLGKDYPKDPSNFRRRCHDAFARNRDLTDPQEIEACISKGEYIVKELEALYSLKKYRTLKRRYHDQPD